MRGIREIEKEIDNLSGYWKVCTSPRVRALIDTILKENEPKLKELREELEAVKSGKPKPKPRWPADVPEDVFNLCEDYWKGAEEYAVYRIHCWNDKGVWTSYPARAWYCQGVRHQGKSTFYILNRKEREYGKPKRIILRDGRVSDKEMKAELDKLV